MSPYLDVEAPIAARTFVLLCVFGVHTLLLCLLMESGFSGFGNAGRDMGMVHVEGDENKSTQCYQSPN